MYDIITIGSSLIDSFIKSREFNLHQDGTNVDICLSYGSKIEVDEYELRTGGGGGNTAVGFARMGFRTGVVTELGTDVLAEIITQEFKKEFVSLNLIISEKQEKTGGSIILLGKDGGRTVMVHRGASSMLDPKDIPTSKIGRAGWVHLSSISGNLKTLKVVFETLKASEQKFSWNPGKKELVLIVNKKISFTEIPCEVLILNKEEWELVKNQQEDILSNVKQVIVTNGKKGGEVYIDARLELKFGVSGNGGVNIVNKISFLNIVRNKFAIGGNIFSLEKNTSVDDTGAGDAFAVGYLTAYLKGKNVRERCEWGKKNALSVIKHIGAKPGLLTIDQVEVHNDASS